jgi:hypothetical protein
MADNGPIAAEAQELDDLEMTDDMLNVKRIASLGVKKFDAPGSRIGLVQKRMLDETEQKLVRDSFEESKHLAVPKDLAGELYWLNYYVDRQFVIEFPLRDEFHQWVVSLLNDVYDDWPEYHILSYGFIISPAGGTVDQRFHYDYTHTSSNIFIPLTKITPLNATQFLRTPLKAHYEDIQWLGDADDLMLKEGRPIEIHQIIVPPMSLLQLLPGTPHRGIANRDNYTRILFFCTVDRKWYKLNEKSYSTKNDAF